MQINEILTLQSIQGIGDKSLIALIKFCESNNIRSLRDLQYFDFPKVSKLNRAFSAIKNFFEDESFEYKVNESENNLEKWKSKSINVVPFGSDIYPKQLTELSDPPPILFCCGNLDLLKTYRSIAVVGTRENTPIGESITKRTVEHFTQKGFCIVSGLAFGIDAIAHQTALETRGTTIAVLVDVANISPIKNRPLADQIIERQGLLISENAPDTKIVPALFAKRDRIQAGLSMAVFAIETSVNGGTMHAVKAAQDLERPIYVPDVIAAKYPDLKEIAISGTQKLIEEKVAQSYSRQSYENIIREIDARTRTDLNFKYSFGSLI